jgi:hypothetical protein
MSDKNPTHEPGPFGGRITDRQLIIPGDHARVIDLNEGAVEALEHQRAAFIEKFGREPGPDDPIFFDPDEDEPTPLTEERQAEIFAEMQGAVDAAGLDIDVVEAFDALGESKRAIQEEHGTSRKIGRNDPCPCGSGLKYKRCHGA